MNFDFIKNIKNFEQLYKYCNKAEESLKYDPTSCTVYCRNALEWIIKFLYQTFISEDIFEMSLYDMISNQDFVNFINDEQLINLFHIIRKYGNSCAHGGQISYEYASIILEDLQFVVGEILISLGEIEDYPNFELEEIKNKDSSNQNENISNAKNNQNISEDPRDEKVIVVIPANSEYRYNPKLRHVKFDFESNDFLDKNKLIFLRGCLADANWKIVQAENLLVPKCAAVNLMLDNNEKVDYVLCGSDNIPLAIIEYTETLKDLISGRFTAMHKANSLEEKYGYKPAIYYTNGYSIYFIDQLGYEARKVSNFHSIEDLELLKHRRTERLDISNPVFDDDIASRPYQQDAIRAACKAFSSMHRGSLLVMATGTGKTRVAIKLSDVLLKARWVKNILFLADRSSLVLQASRSFSKILPNYTTSVYTGGSINRNAQARIIFSTYQTMINLINDETKEFSIGRFDLIIIDEAHRSIFNKYGLIFNYFDSLMLGLTATPREEVNKNTYKVFHLDEYAPDYNYSLEKAITDGYLVGFKSIKVETNDITSLKYEDLSDIDKEKVDDFYSDDPDYIPECLQLSKEYNVYNKGSIKLMLHKLMTEGQKVDDGDKLGKTIIFAKTMVEAKLIKEVFDEIYSEYDDSFCQVVTCKIDNAQQIIDNFTVPEREPQICVSVDMLDTGIDVPSVLNLVFYKAVISNIKFMQMIGRGTRLCPDVFGSGLDKSYFLIFDYYENFDRLNGNNPLIIDKLPNGHDGNLSNIPGQANKHLSQSMSNRINHNKLELVHELLKRDMNDFEKKVVDEITDEFYNNTLELCNDNIAVENNISYVNKYRDRKNWDNLDDQKFKEIDAYLLHLFPGIKLSRGSKLFESCMRRIEMQYFKLANQKGTITQFPVDEMLYGVQKTLNYYVDYLLKLTSIPEIVKNSQVISELKNFNYFVNNHELEDFEYIRKTLLDLASYVEVSHEVLILDHDDSIIEAPMKKSFAEKITEYLNSNDATLNKIRTLEKLTPDEYDILKITIEHFGSDAELMSWLQGLPLLVKIRKEIGIDDNAINSKFGYFLNSNILSQPQLDILNQIIEYAKKNGDFTGSILFKSSCFNNYNIIGIFGNKTNYLKNLIDGIHKPVEEK